ncbi:MAG: hypothetical protein ABR611_02920 [Chthoniobacterales bacterium]
MKKKRAREQGALDLIEEAVHLLRSCPANGAAWYAFATLPFLSALLYFWADMSRGAFAEDHVTEAALGLALLFGWMKFGHAIFAAKLRAAITGDVANFSVRQAARVALSQTILQPTKFFVLPIAALITLPFARAVAFYENVTALGAGETVSDLVRDAGRQAKLWPRPNHLTLALLLLFALFAFANLALLLLLAPHLFKALTGVETVFTRSGINVLNTTFLAAVAALTYLCCDPLVKAIYVLRCFYGESLRSGEDLRVELRRATFAETRLVALLLGMALIVSPINLRAESPPPVQAPELDRSISETLNRPEYSWRMPREQTDTPPPEESSSFLSGLGRWTKKIAKKIGQGISDFFDWLRRHSRPPSDNDSSRGELKSGFAGSSRILLYAVLVLASAAAIFLLIRIILQRGKTDELSAEPMTATKVDLGDETVTADQLPEDEWLALARTLIAEKEFRLAVRALFLAGLAHLAGQQIVSLAKYKSNRDYAAELRRRAADQGAMQQAFLQNMVAVERVWYGLHDVNAEMLERFHANLEEIRAC